MLPNHYRALLIEAAETKNLDRIEFVIERVKQLSPKHFFTSDRDPAMKQRVFQHQPLSAAWSGTAVLSIDTYRLGIKLK